MSLWVVVGGQFGSEGKGKVSAFIAKREKIDLCIRCGGPNSGHSFAGEDGRTIVLRQIPTGFVNPQSRLLIPAGALVDPAVLKHEISMLGLGPDRVGIDRNSFMIDALDLEAEQRLGLREKLGSTLCGVGSALSRRVLRSDDARLAKQAVGEFEWLVPYLTDVSLEIDRGLDRGKKVLIEGTQGFGLSLFHSDFYPKTTSRDTTAASFLSEAGVSPARVTNIVMVLRTFPIRVAGLQSGPLKNEITWGQLQQESGYTSSIEERTTVTQKIRRVGRFDWELAKRATLINKPTVLALNGLDLLDARNRSVGCLSDLSSNAKAFVSRVEKECGVPCGFLGVGPSLADVIVPEPRDAQVSSAVAGT